MQKPFTQEQIDQIRSETGYKPVANNQESAAKADEFLKLINESETTQQTTTEQPKDAWFPGKKIYESAQDTATRQEEISKQVVDKFNELNSENITKGERFGRKLLAVDKMALQTIGNAISTPIKAIFHATGADEYFSKKIDEIKQAYKNDPQYQASLEELKTSLKPAIDTIKKLSADNPGVVEAFGVLGDAIGVLGAAEGTMQGVESLRSGYQKVKPIVQDVATKTKDIATEKIGQAKESIVNKLEKRQAEKTARLETNKAIETENNIKKAFPLIDKKAEQEFANKYGDYGGIHGGKAQTYQDYLKKFPELTSKNPIDNANNLADLAESKLVEKEKLIKNVTKNYSVNDLPNEFQSALDKIKSSVIDKKTGVSIPGREDIVNTISEIESRILDGKFTINDVQKTENFLRDTFNMFSKSTGDPLSSAVAKSANSLRSGLVSFMRKEVPGLYEVNQDIRSLNFLAEKIDKTGIPDKILHPIEQRFQNIADKAGKLTDFFATKIEPVAKAVGKVTKPIMGK